MLLAAACALGSIEARGQGNAAPDGVGQPPEDPVLKSACQELSDARSELSLARDPESRERAASRVRGAAAKCQEAVRSRMGAMNDPGRPPPAVEEAAGPGEVLRPHPPPLRSEWAGRGDPLSAGRRGGGRGLSSVTAWLGLAAPGGEPLTADTAGEITYGLPNGFQNGTLPERGPAAARRRGSPSAGGPSLGAAGSGEEAAGGDPVGGGGSAAGGEARDPGGRERGSASFIDWGGERGFLRRLGDTFGSLLGRRGRAEGRDGREAGRGLDAAHGQGQAEGAPGPGDAGAAGRRRQEVLRLFLRVGLLLSLLLGGLVFLVFRRRSTPRA